ncbi:methyltransferase family protein [Stackebrandtia nassauensis]|uniref:methyltransferase family protein n=1 Tax=Stackebrandtia nassauensis TaxID=283811 RepID=UPI001B7FB868|nr:isoprenylcysteine carboxylmethyltransferase family protein [Stackebrandtia nassauensis]
MVFAAAFGLLFGVRSIQQTRRTGDVGWRFPSPGADRTQWIARLFMGFGGLTGGIAAPAAALMGMPSVTFMDHTWLRITGLVLAAVAAAAAFAAQQSMGASWRIGVDDTEHTALVTTGQFAYVRNPIFTAMFALMTNLALATPNIVAYIGLASVIAGIELQVRKVEEPHLLNTHPDTYRDYAQQAGRFLPGIGRLSR